MAGEMTPEREDEIRHRLATVPLTKRTSDAMGDLLDTIAALRARVAELEAWKVQHEQCAEEWQADDPATCWWAAPPPCPLHGASVFLCPRRPEGV